MTDRLIKLIQQQQKQINRLENEVRRLKNRMMNNTARATLAATSDNEGSQKHQVQLLADEVKDNIEHFQPFGFSSIAPAGSETAIIFMGGNRDHAISFGSDNKKYRPKGGANGDTVVYDINGNVVNLTASKIIIQHSAEVTIIAPKTIVESPEIELNGNVKVAGNLAYGQGGTSGTMTGKGNIDIEGSITSTGDQKAGGISQIHHTHKDNGAGKPK